MVALICFAAVNRVGAGKLEDAEADGRILVEVGVDAVVERGELDARHILQTHDRVVVLLDDDVAELHLDRRGDPASAPMIWKAPGEATGGWFKMPAATCTFCRCSAVTTSFAVSARDCRRSGSSQTRIE